MVCIVWSHKNSTYRTINLFPKTKWSASSDPNNIWPFYTPKSISHLPHHPTSVIHMQPSGPNWDTFLKRPTVYVWTVSQKRWFKVFLTFAILDVLTASRPLSSSNFEELVLNHWTLLDPSEPPVTEAVTVTLLPSLRSPIILRLATFGGAEIRIQANTQQDETINENSS